MLTFKQFLMEMPYFAAAVPKKPTRHWKLPAGSKKFKDVGDDYELHVHPQEKGYSLVHKKTKQVHMLTKGVTIGPNKDMYGINYTQRQHPTPGITGHDFYKHILDHKPIVSDNSHSPGAKHLWTKLAGDKDLEVIHMTKRREKVTPKNIDDFYGSDSAFAVRKKSK
jgi:hypothetical protein